MQMSEVFTNTFTVRGGSRDDVRGYEHVLTVLLPWRRYDRQAQPVPCQGSPSRFEVGDESRHGTPLSVIRLTSDPIPSTQALAEMTGELAEAWVCMTFTHSKGT